MGFCPGIHDDKLKAAFQAEVAKGAQFGYERQHERTLERFVDNAERKIARSKRRTDDGSAIPSIDVDRAPEIAEISKQIEDKVKEAETAGEAGEVDKSMALMSEAEVLRRKKAEIQAKLVRVQPGASGGADQPNMGNRQRLRVCDICGAFLSLNDSDDRLADHFGGRVHLGFLAVRQKLASMRPARPAGAPPASAGATSSNSVPVAAPKVPAPAGPSGSGSSFSSSSSAQPPPSSSNGSSSGSGYGGYSGYGGSSSGRDRDYRDGGSSRDNYRSGGGGSSGYDGRRDDGYRRDDYRSGGGGRDDYRGGGGRDRDYRDGGRRDYDRGGRGDRERSRSRE